MTAPAVTGGYVLKIDHADDDAYTWTTTLGNIVEVDTPKFSDLVQPQKDYIRQYGEVVVYTTLLTIGGRYSGKAQRGQFRALVLWARRDGRWQQIASQMTAVAAP